MTPTMEDVAGWLRRAAMSCDAFGEHCTAEEFRQHAAQVEAMAKSQLDAVTHLVEIGKACERCEWEIDKVLWCTDSHNITVRKLLSLEGLQKTEAMTCAAQVEAMGWRPIEEAPRTSEEVDLWDDFAQARIADCKWMKNAWYRWEPNTFETMDWCKVHGKLTHFMRKPQPPCNFGKN